MNEPVAVAILAKAPVPGFAKTRLIAQFGSERAARLQASLIAHAAATACHCEIGPVTLWAAPDAVDSLFQTLQSRLGLALACQSDGDLGTRMLTAVAAADGPALVIGTDCPALSSDHLRTAANALRSGTEVVLFPAEDGGYVLIGMRTPHAALFEPPIRWGTPRVLGETRRRLQRLRLAWQEPTTLWDIDEPRDVERLRTGKNPCRLVF